ncbi:MAG: hypothetical protein H6563_07940 [Lewinellaceae bacterium]|nr:hypothetical protein [Lewinellaceae bacterium]
MKISMAFAVLFLCLITGGSLRAQTQSSTLPDYVDEPDSAHIVLIVLSEIWADVREISGEVVKYNLKLYPEKELVSTRVSMPFLSNLPVLYVHSFANKADAMAYYRRLYKPKPDFMQMNIVESVWVLSKGNLNTLLLEGSVKRYEPFFKEHYLSQ